MPRRLCLVFLLIALITTSLYAALPQVLVTDVVDGDTIKVDLNGRRETIRFIGVDTPESTKVIEPYGKEASEFTRSQLLGKKVVLEFDVGERDKYGRLLAYVWTVKPSVITEETIRKYMFNAILLLEGYAQVMTVPPNVKYAELFLKFQQEAREAGKGLWGLELTTKSQEDIIVYITKSGSKYHLAGCKYLSKSSIPIKLSEAKAKGYTPCSVCKPPY